jgi:hypothetical protein
MNPVDYPVDKYCRGEKDVPLRRFFCPPFPRGGKTVDIRISVH